MSEEDKLNEIIQKNKHSYCDKKDVDFLLHLLSKKEIEKNMLEANGFRNGLYAKDGNYISKDKIREKIKEYLDYDNKYFGKDETYHTEEYYKAKTLKELLGE